MISFKLELDYSLSFGEMKKWSDALLIGDAIALKCKNCKLVSFPPLRTCKCLSKNRSWVPLSGLASIISITIGLDGCFGLVKFDGANNSVIAKLKGFSNEGKRGQLISSNTSIPQLILEPINQKVN